MAGSAAAAAEQECRSGTVTLFNDDDGQQGARRRTDPWVPENQRGGGERGDRFENLSYGSK